jgi:hypothetical protein
MSVVFVTEQQIMLATPRLDPQAMEQLNAVAELVNFSGNDVVVGTVATNAVVLVRLNDPLISVEQQVSMGTLDELVATSTRVQTSAVVLLNENTINTATFEAADGERTNPCATCIVIHALLDHVLSWQRDPTNPNRTEGVAQHNVALVRQGSRERTGSDHTSGPMANNPVVPAGPSGGSSNETGE